MTTSSTDRLPPVLVAIYRGVIYRDVSASLWEDLLALQSQVRDHVGVLGLELILDETEGYAHLRQRPTDDDAPDLPRLVRRHQLSYPVSLLIIMLRKKLTEHDAQGTDPMLVLSATQIHDLVRLFFSSSTNEARVMDKITAHINKVVELGFLRRLRGEEDVFEVRRIIKSFVDAQLLSDIESRLAEYRTHDERKTEEA